MKTWLRSEHTWPSWTRLLGACLFASSIALFFWLGHLFPFPPAPVTLGQAVEQASAYPAVYELWFLLPIIGSALGLFLIFRGSPGIRWVHAGALVTGVMMLAARGGLS